MVTSLDPFALRTAYSTLSPKNSTVPWLVRLSPPLPLRVLLPLSPPPLRSCSRLDRGALDARPLRLRVGKRACDRSRVGVRVAFRGRERCLQSVDTVGLSVRWSAQRGEHNEKPRKLVNTELKCFSECACRFCRFSKGRTENGVPRAYGTFVPPSMKSNAWSMIRDASCICDKEGGVAVSGKGRGLGKREPISGRLGLSRLNGTGNGTETERQGL